MHQRLLAAATIWQGCNVTKIALACRTLTTMTQTSAALRRRGERMMQVRGVQQAGGICTNLYFLAPSMQALLYSRPPISAIV